MSIQTSRRAFLANTFKYTGLLAAGGVGASAMHAVLPHRSQAAASTGHPWPWPYVKLDVEAGRKLGHDSYWSGKGCSYAAFYPIVHALEQEIGAPFTNFPAEMMIYGHGGGAGWGGLCGALNGAAAAICLVTDKKTSDMLISDLFGWYTQAFLPTDCSNEYALKKAYGVNKYNEKVQQNKSGSILCHVSGSLWSNHAGFKIIDLERKERCARLTGDTVAFAIALLNDNFDGKFKPVASANPVANSCNTCHGKEGEKPDVLSKMDCMQCHGDPHAQ
jgi:hypothetical protein